MTLNGLVRQPPTVVRLVHNTGFSLGANILARLAHVILFVMLSRLAGPSEAGILTIGLTYLAIAGRLSIWGLDQILVRDVAQDLSRAGKYLFNFVLLRIILATSVSLLLGVILWSFKPYRPEVTWLIYLITLNMLPEGLLNLSQAVFMAHERLEFMTLTGAFVGALKLLFSGTALILGFGIRGVVWGLLLANTLAAIGALLIVFWYFVAWRPEIDLHFCRVQLKVAAPFVIIAGAYMVDNQLDVLLLSWQVDEASVGLYGAAITLITGIAFLPQAYRDAVFPKLASAFSSSQERLRRLYEHSYKYLILISVPITLGLITLAEPILIWIFGNDFASAAAALQLLAISVGLLFLGILHNRLLIIANQQSKIAYFLAIGLLLNTMLNLGLVPRLGITGAAAARLTSNLAVFCLTYYVVFTQIYAFKAQRLWIRPLIAGVFMIVILWLISEWSVWLRILGGSIAYGAALLTLGTFSQREVVTWLQILRLDRLVSKVSSS